MSGELAPHCVVQHRRKFDYIGGFATVIAAQNAGHDVDSRLAILDVILMRLSRFSERETVHGREVRYVNEIKMPV